MAKNPYTDEEIKQILQALFFEKKRTKELEKKLQEVESKQVVVETLQNPPKSEGSDDVEKLKMLLDAQKKMYDQVLIEIEDKDKVLANQANFKNDTISALQSDLEKAQKTLSELEQRALFAEDESESFRKQYKTLKDALDKTQEQAQKYKNEFDDLLKHIHEKEHVLAKTQEDELERLRSETALSSAKEAEFHRQLEELQENVHRQNHRIEKMALVIQERDKRISELQQFEFSFKKANEQKLEFEAYLDTERVKIEAMAGEKQKLAQDLAESRLHNEQLERVIQHLRERAEEAHLEANQFQEEFQSAHDKIAKLTAQLNDANKEIEDISKRLFQEQHEKKEFEEELIAIRDQFTHLKSKVFAAHKELEKRDASIAESQKILEQVISERDKLESLLQNKNTAKDSEVALLAEQLSLKEQEINKFKVDLRTQEQISEERDAQFKMAQQHLAKKVKETAILSEQLEAQKMHNLDLQNAVSQSKVKISEMQSTLEIQAHLEKRLQEQLAETMKSFESQLGKWEDKYFRLHDKWQDAETRIQELKKYEEKHNQLQAILGNFGAVLGSPQTSKIEEKRQPLTHEIPNIAAEASVEERQPVEKDPLPFEQTESEEHPKSHQQNLFEKSQNAPRFKQNLFD